VLTALRYEALAILSTVRDGKNVRHFPGLPATPMTTLVFGHKSPDTDSTGSPIIWAWYLNEIGGDAEAVLLGEPNTEAAFMLERWGWTSPRSSTASRPASRSSSSTPTTPPSCPRINAADIRAIIDHHKLVGGLETKGPIDITDRARWPAPPRSCTR
jgi:manganese-dependent inorganic pyrophosphatase